MSWELAISKQWQCILASKAFHWCPTVSGWERHWKLVIRLLFTSALKYPYLGSNPWLRSTFQTRHRIAEQCHWALMEFDGKSAQFHVRPNLPISVLTGSWSVSHTGRSRAGRGDWGMSKPFPEPTTSSADTSWEALPAGRAAGTLRACDSPNLE